MILDFETELKVTSNNRYSVFKNSIKFCSKVYNFWPFFGAICWAFSQVSSRVYNNEKEPDFSQMIKNEYETSTGIDSVTPMYFGIAIAAAFLSGILGVISLGSAPKHLFIRPDTSMLGGAGSAQSNAIVTQ